MQSKREKNKARSKGIDFEPLPEMPECVSSTEFTGMIPASPSSKNEETAYDELFLEYPVNPEKK